MAQQSRLLERFNAPAVSTGLQLAEVPSPLFNLWVSVGLALESFLVLLLTRRFTPWSILSGAFFIISTANTFFAIQNIGLATASATWCGTAVLVSFGFGLWSGERLSRPLLALPAILGILAGITGIAYANMTSERLRSSGGDTGGPDAEQPLVGDGAVERSQRNTRLIKGSAAAVAAGVFGGLILAPMSWAPAEQRGLSFMSGMGFGVILGAPPMTAAVLALSGERMPSAVQMRVSAVFGTLSGCIWGAGNAASIIAVQSGAGLSVAYPIMQAGLFVAGLWGLLLFHELHARAQPMYWASGAVLIGGTSLLAISK